MFRGLALSYLWGNISCALPRHRRLLLMGSVAVAWVIDCFWLFFHGTDGRLLGQEIAGKGTLGEQFYRLQLPIQGGRIIGFTGQVMIAVSGVLIAGSSATGVYIWWGKWQARRISKARKSSLMV